MPVPRLSRLVVPALAAALIAAGPALAQIVTFVETFESGSNTGQWSYGTGNEFIQSLNGNPGAYLEDPYVVSFNPAASTRFGDDSPFTGDYRARGVTSVGIDMITLDASLGTSGRYLSLILLNDNGTPDDFGDDWGAYIVGDKPVPSAGVIGVAAAGWNSYDFDIPADATTTPEGWIFHDRDGGRTWNDLITDVDVVQFSYGDPSTYYLLSAWQLGMDNPRISFVPERGDLDRDGDVDRDDLIVLAQSLGACPDSGDCPADLTGDGTVDQHDILEMLDLLSFGP